MSGTEEGCPRTRKEMTLEDWTAKWDENETKGFHRKVRHEKLERFKDSVVAGRDSLKFFFPLCGKVLDMKWMYDEGHTVVGIEASAKGVEEFFSENDMQYTKEAVEKIDGTVYKSEDGRLRIYCCDFFRFCPDVEKDFNAAFDRGSFGAINVADRKRYAETVVPLLAQDCRYMLVTVEYDGSQHQAPPHPLTEEELEATFGDTCNMEVVIFEDLFEEKFDRWGITAVKERVVILTPKTK